MEPDADRRKCLDMIQQAKEREAVGDYTGVPSDILEGLLEIRDRILKSFEKQDSFPAMN